MVKDMTKGNSLKLILEFCLPLLAGNLFQQVYNMVDAMIVGRYLGVDALAGVGLTNSLTFLVIGFVIGLCSGFGINIAQSFGAGDYKMMRRYMMNSFYICIIASVLLTTVTVYFTNGMLNVMQTPSDIFHYAHDYIIVIFAGISITILYNILSSILRAVGDSITPLIFLAVACIINIILDIVFVKLLNFGVAGAAYATLISQTFSAAACIIYIRKKYVILHINKDEFAFDLKLSAELLSKGVPMALQFSITAIGTIILQKAVNTQGSEIIAAVTAANRIQTMAIQPMETLGLTMATYGGQNLGAKNYPRIKKGMNQSIILGLAYSIFIFIVVVFAGKYLAMLFIDSSKTTVIGYVSTFLRINGIFYPFLSVLFILRNALQGLGYGFLPMMAGVTELFARAAVAEIFVYSYGFSAVCLASPVAWICADILLISTYVIKQKDLKIKCNFNLIELNEDSEKCINQS